jgi:hypothetical protein
MTVMGAAHRKRAKVIVIAVVTVAVAVVTALYVVPMARHRSQNVALGRQWAGLLRKHPTFSGKPSYSSADLAFAYADPTDANLTRLRELYDLEAIAGQGSETERIVSLMSWVYRLTGHANEPEIPKELNAINLIRLATVEHMQINCYMKTVILNEVYLAMGWQSRQTHLLPHSNEEEESHFVTSVYAPTLGKWIAMDPDFGAYVTDEEGNILGVSEIRSRLVAGRPLRAVDVDAGGRLTNAWGTARNVIQGVDYTWFLTDFVFKVRCPQRSLFNQAAQPGRVFFELIPDGYRPDLLREPTITDSGKIIVYTNDEDLFWKKPS